MKFRHIKHRLNTFQLLLTVFCILMLGSCGGSSNSSSNSSSGSGALFFKIAYHLATNDLQLKAATIDCAGQGIVTVEAKVYDPDNGFLSGGAWDCEAGYGTIISVPAGSGRTVVILGKGADGNIVFHGQKSGIEVVANSENNAGTIDCNTFVPSLLSPADGAVEAGTMGLQWNEVDGASEYRIVVSQNPDLRDPVIDHITTTTNHTPSGLDYATIYYWQVLAIDSYGNNGIGSAIWAFKATTNTAPIAIITGPVDDSTFTTADTIKFAGRGSDNEDGALSGDSLVWSSDLYGQIGTGETCSSDNLAIGTHQITLLATDSDGLTGTGSITITINEDFDNTSPVAQITIPEKGSTYIVDQESQFSGGATDSEDGDLNGDSLVWTSNMYTDPICEGKMCTTDKLGVGTHKITLTAKDSAGATGKDTVVITVATSRLPDTGQKESQFPNYTPTPGEDMTYDINPPAYTKLDINGNNLADDATGDWVMVRDDVTGLIWEVKTEDGSIHDKDNTYQWPNIQTGFIGKLNSDEFGGFNDWRLPTVKELYSLVHNINIDSDEPIATEYFPNTKQTFYWSSTSYAIDTDDAWSLNFYNGSVVGYNKSDDYFVRAVRGGQSSANILVDNGDDTVTDTATGLMWQKLEVMNEGGTEVQRMTWEEALAYCEKLDLASYDDWRLPNAKELQSIADYEKAEPPCIDKIFWNAKPHPYWSSTIVNSTGSVWIVVFKKGNVFILNKYKTVFVRAVRGGK